MMPPMETILDLDRLRALYRQHVAEITSRYFPVLVAGGFDGVVLHSGSLRKRVEFDDQYWPLRPTPHFQHWLPLPRPDCALLVRPGHKPLLAWIKNTSYWEKPPALETDHFRTCFEIVEIEKPEEVKAHLPAGVKIAFVGEDRARGTSWGLPDEALNPPALVGALDLLRSRKTPYEVACIDEANRRAARGHDAVRRRFFDGDDAELGLHLAFLGATAQDDPETPYKNIVALGKNGATLHHIAYVKEALHSPTQSLLLDAGATYQGYCSDITRTWVKGQGPTADAFAQLIAETEAMQQRLCGQVALGLNYEELHDDAHRQVAGLLRTVGLCDLSSDEIVAAKISRAFFPHGLGHSLGLQCHDVGCALVKPKVDNLYLRNTSTIAVGQVFTIEPGIYFIDTLMGQLRQGPHAGSIDWRLCDALGELGGVRIEDDLHITGGETVARNLTRELLPEGGGRS